MDALGAFYFKPGRLAAEAKPLLRKGLARQSGQCWGWARLLLAQGKAEPLFWECLASARETLGPKHPGTLAARGDPGAAAAGTDKRG